MNNKKKTATAIGILALIAAALGFAGAVKADDDTGDDDNGKWKGPDPGKPGGPRPKKPKGGDDRPTHVDPHDLWISPDCDDLIVGDRWLADTATPAILDWLEQGYGAPLDDFDDDTKAAVTWGRDAIVRGILGPYSPLCIDAYPWRDNYEYRYPKPQWEPPAGAELQAWNEAIVGDQDAWAASYPGLFKLITDLQLLVSQMWADRNP